MKKRKKKLLRSSKGNKGRFPRNTKKYQQLGRDDEGMGSVKIGTSRLHRSTSKYEPSYAWVDHGMVRRLLRKHVGKPWDKVWSEICSDYDPRTYEGYEVRTWMEFAVEQNCFIDEDGEVINEHGNKIGRWMDCYYVHPETGLLEYIQPKRKWQREEPQQTVFEMDGQLYHCHEGLWYRVRMKELKRIERTRYIRDYKTGKITYRYTYKDWQHPHNEVFGSVDWLSSNTWGITAKLREKYGLSPNRQYWYCCWKESANGKEIAKLRKKYKMAA